MKKKKKYQHKVSFYRYNILVWLMCIWNAWFWPYIWIAFSVPGEYQAYIWKDWLLMAACCLLPPLMVDGFGYYVFRWCTYVLFFDDYLLSAQYLKKDLCRVDLNRPVYYSIFEGAFYQAERHIFILLSNEPFENTQTYGKPGVKYKKQTQMIFTYDRTKQILLVFDKKTASYLDADHWNAIDQETIVRKTECQLKWMK